MENQQDQLCLKKVADGDKQALVRLHTRYASDLHAYLSHLTRDGRVAEELVQEVFLIVWQDADRFQGRSTVKTWLFGIAHNLGLLHLRRSHREISDDGRLMDMASQDPDPIDWTIHSLECHRLNSALAKLSPTHRAVIELTFYHSLSQNESAHVLNCPVGTIKSRLHYALKALANALRSEGE